jgi:hypothetical protein
VAISRSRAIRRSISAFAAMLTLALSAHAAELPVQSKAQAGGAKPTQSVERCNIAGLPGVLGAGGVCVKVSGYISTGVAVGHLK